MRVAGCTCTAREMQTFDVVWQGDPLSVVKSFGTRECQLCSREKINVAKWSRKDPEMLINTCSEICGRCRHKLRFHRCREEVEDTSTDELMESERVNLCGNNSVARGAGTLEGENPSSICEETQHSFCQAASKDISDKFEFPSPNLLSQPPILCSTAASGSVALCCPLDAVVDHCFLGSSMFDEGTFGSTLKHSGWVQQTKRE